MDPRILVWDPGSSFFKNHCFIEGVSCLPYCDQWLYRGEASCLPYYDQWLYTGEGAWIEVHPLTCELERILEPKWHLPLQPIPRHYPYQTETDSPTCWSYVVCKVLIFYNGLYLQALGHHIIYEHFCLQVLWHDNILIRIPSPGIRAP